MRIQSDIHFSGFKVRDFSARTPGGFVTIDMDAEGTIDSAAIYLHTPEEADKLIKAAVAARSMLLGETSEPVPQGDLPLCGEAKAGVGGVMCTRPADHAGGHKHEYSGTYWPRHDGGSEDPMAGFQPDPEQMCKAKGDSPYTCTLTRGHAGDHVAHGRATWPQDEDLDAALTPPGYSLPAGELGWDEPLPPFHSKGGPQCAAEETPGGFICTAQPDHAGPLHVAYGFDGEICHSWLLTADAPAERAR